MVAANDMLLQHNNTEFSFAVALRKILASRYDFESFGMIWLLHIRVSNRLYWRRQFLLVRWGTPSNDAMHPLH